MQIVLLLQICIATVSDEVNQQKRFKKVYTFRHFQTAVFFTWPLTF